MLDRGKTKDTVGHRFQILAGVEKVLEVAIPRLKSPGGKNKREDLKALP